MPTLDTLPAAPHGHAAHSPARFDLYGPIHKALRLFMGDTLARVGWLDTEDATELTQTLAQVEGLLQACRHHLVKENQYLHAAIEARCAGASDRVAREHVGHLEAIAALEAEVAALRARPSAAAAFRLYRHLARFVAEHFEHMHREESDHNATLWSAYSDAELVALHRHLLASIEPAEMMLVLRWLVPALTPAERAALLGPMQRELPPESMRAVLATVRPHLDTAAWAKLAQALNLPSAA